MAKRKSARQVRFLFSSGSPLTDAQRDNLASEISSGAVRVSGKRQRPGLGGRRRRVKTRVRGR